MAIVFAGLSPHPPIIVPEIGKEALARCSATRGGLAELADRLKAARPDAIFLISPHGPVFEDAISILARPSFHGNFSRFGAPDIAVSAEGDSPLTDRIVTGSERRKIPLMKLDEKTCSRFGIPEELDHATMVPLHYFQEAGLSVPLALAGIGFVSYQNHFHFGEAVREAMESDKRRIAFIASGDLSHRLIPEAPAGYDPIGKVFDAQIITALKEKKFDEILTMDKTMISRAGECGFRPIVTLLGAIHDLNVNPDVISYEGPFGVGYGVIDFGLR